jgi:hypothetical protein
MESDYSTRGSQEIAPLTEEQWNYLVYLYRSMLALRAARQFSASMRQIQAMAGESATDSAALSSAIGKLAEMDETEQEAQP